MREHLEHLNANTWDTRPVGTREELAQVEHEYFMAAAPSLHSSNEDFFWKRRSPPGTGAPEAHAPGSNGDAFSASPPDSFGSGPSYNEIARLENVGRLLNSQEGGHTSDESTENVSKRLTTQESSSYGGAELTNSPVQQNRAIIEALCKSPPVVTTGERAQRSQSTTSLPGHDLTPENLHKFTKLQARQHKANWKRKISQGTLSGCGSNNTTPQCHSAMENVWSGNASQNSPTRGMKRPLDDDTEISTLTSQPKSEKNSTFDNEVSFLTHRSGVNAVGMNLYRLLGPTPAPPPGTNLHITSTPLSNADKSASLQGDRPSAFKPTVVSRKKAQRSSRSNRSPVSRFQTSIDNRSPQHHQSTMLQPLNLSLRCPAQEAEHLTNFRSTPQLQKTTVIQQTIPRRQSRGFQDNAWSGFNMESEITASLALQRMTQLPRQQNAIQLTDQLSMSGNQIPLYSIAQSDRIVPNLDSTQAFKMNNFNDSENGHFSAAEMDENLRFSTSVLPYQNSQQQQQSYVYTHGQPHLTYHDIGRMNQEIASQNFSLNSEIISSIREATESSIMLGER